MPRRSASATSTTTWSRIVMRGNRDPYGRPSPASDAGPVVPWQPPSTFGHTTKKRSVSMGAPGPIIPSHHPGCRCPGPAGPAAWLSPVSACSTSTALSRAGASVPHVSYATITCSSRPPASRTCGRVSNTVTNWRRPGSSPGRHAPVTGIGGAAGRSGESATLGGAEPSVEVGEDVVDGLDADAQPHQVGRDAGRHLLVGGELRVGGGRRVDREAAHVTHVGQVAEQLQVVDERAAGLEPTLDAEREDRALPARQVLLTALVPLARRQTRVRDPLHFVALFEPLGDGERVRAVTIHSQAERLEALEEEERVERRHWRADVAHQLEPGLEDVLGGPQRLGELRV